MLVEGGLRGAVEFPWGSLSSLSLQFGAPMFKPLVKNAFPPYGGQFPHPTAFPEPIGCVPAGILSPQVSSLAPGAFPTGAFQDCCSENGTEHLLNSLLINPSSCF